MDEKPSTPTIDKDAAAIVVSLGKQSAKRVKQLSKGKGKLVEQISASLASLQEQGTIGKNVQPVIVVVKENEGFSLFR